MFEKIVDGGVEVVVVAAEATIGDLARRDTEMRKKIAVDEA